MMRMTSKDVWAYILVLGGAIGVLVYAYRHAHQVPYQKNAGMVFGTTYHITYQNKEDLRDSIVAVFRRVDGSLSPFNKRSVITAVNDNCPIRLDKDFLNVFNLSGEVYKNTNGAFDITVAPLVNAWGFGFRTQEFPDDEAIDSLRQFVGFDKITIKDGRIAKKDKRTMLDCSAIAKGYAVDQVAEMLRGKGVENFLVEVGGEIVARGDSPKGDEWRIGVTKPKDDTLSVDGELQNVVRVTDIAMATSGNYRNFYIYKGKKYSHTIDPRTGYPARQNLLSATVTAETCAEADAYATAFMTMGYEKTRQFLASNPAGKRLGVYLIYTKGNATCEYASDKFMERIRD